MSKNGWIGPNLLKKDKKKIRKFEEVRFVKSLFVLKLALNSKNEILLDWSSGGKCGVGN